MVSSPMSNESSEHGTPTPARSVKDEKQQRLTAESSSGNCGKQSTPIVVPVEDDLCTEWFQEVPC